MMLQGWQALDAHQTQNLKLNSFRKQWYTVLLAVFHHRGPLTWKKYTICLITETEFGLSLVLQSTIACILLFPVWFVGHCVSFLIEPAGLWHFVVTYITTRPVAYILCIYMHIYIPVRMHVQQGVKQPNPSRICVHIMRAQHRFTWGHYLWVS